ncbi:TIGR03943 family putative permease subunit [Streptomyces sp. NPDC002643]
MKRPLQSLLLLLSGVGLLHATLLTDLYLTYVKPGMRPLLIASGAVLLALGAAEAWSLWRPNATAGKATPNPDLDPDPDHGHVHGHVHSTPPRVAWLLFLPAVSLLFYAPPAIGAYTASQEPTKAVEVKSQDEFDPLPGTSPLPMTLTDFTTRVRQDRERAIEGRLIQMTGYVTPENPKGATDNDGETDNGDGGDTDWYLTRTIFTCCAADAQFVKVRVHGIAPPPADTWVTLTGTWHEQGTLGTNTAQVALDAHTVRQIPRPSNGYTDALPLPAG